MKKIIDNINNGIQAGKNKVEESKRREEIKERLCLMVDFYDMDKAEYFLKVIQALQHGRLKDFTSLLNYDTFDTAIPQSIFEARQPHDNTWYWIWEYQNGNYFGYKRNVAEDFITEAHNKLSI